MTTLKTILDGFRNAAATEREKGTYFEELICTYLRNETIYRDLYSDVWTYADWATLQGLDGRDAGVRVHRQRQTGAGLGGGAAVREDR